MGFDRITDAEVVVHLQRYYDVSYATMLSRLKAVGLIKEEDRERLRDVQPVYAARELGYQIEEEEWGFGQTTWGLDTLPKRLVRSFATPTPTPASATSARTQKARRG